MAEKRLTAKERADALRTAQRNRNKRMKERKTKSQDKLRDFREKVGYEKAAGRMAIEAANNEKPGFEGRANRFLDRLGDDIGDVIRRGASAIGIDNDFDTGAMRARKEIKGYNKGGKAKTYKKGGKVRGCGLARGGRPCKMVRMKGA